MSELLELPPGLGRFEGALETPLLARVVGLLREREPEFAFLRRERIPWTRPGAKLAELRIALVTTAGLHLAGDARFRALEEPLGDTSFRVVPHGAGPEDLDLDAPYLDRKYTIRDPQVALPTEALDALHRDGRVGAPSRRHYSFCAGIVRPYPGLARSVDSLAPSLVEDGVGAVVVIPTCSTCVQTAALLAGELEQLGWPTVALSLLPELSRIVGVPRTLALHFPFGAPCGDPFNRALQRAVLAEALDLLESAPAPGEVRESRHTWRAKPDELA